MKKIALVSILTLTVVLVSGCNLKDKFSKETKKIISKTEAEEKAEKFIRENLIQSGMEADVVEVKLENGVYKTKVVVKMEGQEQEVDTYISQDGKIFFPSGADIEMIEKAAQERAEMERAAAEEATKEVPKTDKPEVDLYVMSFCPYGNRAEDTLKPVYDLLKNKINLNIHYIVSSNGDRIESLHGETEVAQNQREVCVLKNYGKDKWFGFAGYVNAKCGSDGSCWETAAKNNGLSVDKIKACVSTQGVALMKAEEKVSLEAGASGSPTMLINGVSSRAVYQYGNPEAYKKAICDSFTNVPAVCGKELSKISEVNAGGSCN